MGQLRCRLAFTSVRAAAIAALLACTPAVSAETDPEARFRGTGKADPVRIANVACKPADAKGASAVAFDLAWDHSWRAAWEEPEERHGGKGTLKLESWDAAWVFVKFRKPGVDGWSHATLSTNAPDHSAPAGAKLDIGPSDDGKRGLGVFVSRAAAGSGANDWKGVTLRWLHEADGMADPKAAELKVFAVQMAYVPQCAFWAGDGSKTVLAGQFSAGDTAEPFRIESEDAITLGGESKKNLGNRDGLGMRRAEDFTSGGTQTLPARFPKGHAAFYCMRHEVTEGQYVEFLNTVASGRQGGRAPIEMREGRQPLTRIKIAVPGKPGTPAVYESATPHVACRGLIWSDLTTYAAWAGLRPMTELEYEKACRGPLRPVPDEYAWGTAGIVGFILLDGTSLIEATSANGSINRKEGQGGWYVLQNAGKPDERVVWQGSNGPDTSHGNAVWGGVIKRVGGLLLDGYPHATAVPPRVGAFATPDSGRVAAGASYWGIMELSGNLWERVVAVGNPPGRRFAGTHGDWPEVKTGPETYGWGFGLRGGAICSWPGSDEHNRLRTSDREMMAAVTPVGGGGEGARGAAVNTSFRCVRTAKIVPIAGILPPPEAVQRPLLTDKGTPVLRRAASGSGSDLTVSIENVTVVPRDAKTATVTFDISWKDSWRDKNNHDAAWVFFKARAEGKKEWQHVRLTADRVVNPTGYGQAEGGTRLDFIVPDGDDGYTGMFVRRAANGEGPLSASRVTAVLDVTANKGITKDAKVQPFGIRMVYVPEGPFCLGSGGVEVGGFCQYTDGSQHTQPYRVTGPGAIRTGRQAGKLWVRKNGGALEDGGEIPASFPNGYAAFYCMQFRILPQEYARFLNALGAEQAGERFPGEKSSIAKSPTGGYSGLPGGARQGHACRGLSWADGATFAAWAGLRPMTELELEKAVRGSREPIPDEVGPSYWGVSGFNSWDWDAMKGDSQSERAVTVGNAKGRQFAGTHGRGTLTLPADWPQADAVGSGVRCNYYSSSALDQARAKVAAPGFFSIFTNSKCGNTSAG